MIMIIKISIIVFSCVRFISTYWMLYGLHCGRQVHCGWQGQQGGHEEADMTFSPFFSKSVQSVSKLIQKMGNGQKHLKYGFGPL